ncbi:hypothetical protein CCACVL1_30138 [Corchorus capsularis]|uniref:Uncharacterized protein n=1 Tax=Corchorus capsularis TaxID=210143 RepID=A0A1R3FYJ7_COCAP|nr:hypothetical protein CCACVL1_30138 [Corchorus capsularis]
MSLVNQLGRLLGPAIEEDESDVMISS